jgi:crotonobetainyl-CoA:carnitine CoA-transferase CaiB-like acyl-CoA transferase
MLPLDGVTVVSLEQAVSAPFATRQLADLGAAVIKIERPGGGDFARYYDETVNGMSSHFVWLNRSKKSLTLDIKHPLASDVLHRLLTRADVFVQNLAPGAAARAGLDSADVTQRYPRLIQCNISGYGKGGPYEHKKAYDLLVQCETGVVSTTGTDADMVKVGVSIADIAAGMYAYSGILTALYQREKTGRGTVLDVSLFDALGEWMGYPAYYTAYSGTAPPRSGLNHATIAPYGPYPTGDGRLVMLGIQNEREWQVFCREVIRQPELATDARFQSNSQRVANRDDMDRFIAAAFAGLSVTEVIARLDEAKIANAQINTMQEFWDHAQLQARDRWRTIGSPVGPLQALLPPVVMEGAEVRMDPVPAPGEHNQEILRTLGYRGDDISRFEAEAVI